ncbi:MAG: CDP-alcohol phosphatidyltransferase family protein [bacterium]|nr:CDP-alcohol phosphatidyltransferase family protein [bacterium]
MRICTIPNVLTASRILVSPLIIWMALSNSNRALIWVLVAVFSVTDAVDGWFARTFGQETSLGAQLDPLADKIYPLSIFSALFIYHGVNPYTVLVYGAPTVFILWYSVVVSVMRLRGQIQRTSKDAKVKQVFVYLAIVFLMLAAAFEHPWIVWPIETVGIICGWHAAVLCYTTLQEYRRASCRRATARPL